MQRKPSFFATMQRPAHERCIVSNSVVYAIITTANDTNCIIGGSCFLIKTQYNKIVRAYSQIIMKGKGASNEKMYIINVCACYFCVPCFDWV